MLAATAIVGAVSAGWVLMDVLPAGLSGQPHLTPAVPVPQLRPQLESGRTGSMAVAANVQPSACPSVPVLIAASGDGLFALNGAVASGSTPSPRSYARAAEEVAASGRVRDAEVAWIAACRSALTAFGARSVPVADMLARLARHYRSVSSDSQPAAALQDAQLRAGELLAESAAIYAAVLGDYASKTRHAHEALASFARARARESDETASAAAGEEVPGPVDAPAAAAEIASRAQAAVVVHDPELVQLESDLSRLRAQAAAVTQDPQGFRRRSALARARAEACGQDKQCLLNWYTQRRRQLIDEF
jgi:hypothetical protein